MSASAKRPKTTHPSASRGTRGVDRDHTAALALVGLGGTSPVPSADAPRRPYTRKRRRKGSPSEDGSLQTLRSGIANQTKLAHTFSRALSRPPGIFRGLAVAFDPNIGQVEHYEFALFRHQGVLLDWPFPLDLPRDQHAPSLLSTPQSYHRLQDNAPLSPPITLPFDPSLVCRCILVYVDPIPELMRHLLLERDELSALIANQASMSAPSAGTARPPRRRTARPAIPSASPTTAATQWLFMPNRAYNDSFTSGRIVAGELHQITLLRSSAHGRSGTGRSAPKAEWESDSGSDDGAPRDRYVDVEIVIPRDRKRYDWIVGLARRYNMHAVLTREKWYEWMRKTMMDEMSDPGYPKPHPMEGCTPRYMYRKYRALLEKDIPDLPKRKVTRQGRRKGKPQAQAKAATSPAPPAPLGLADRLSISPPPPPAPGAAPPAPSMPARAPAAAEHSSSRPSCAPAGSHAAAPGDPPTADAPAFAPAAAPDSLSTAHTRDRPSPGGAFGTSDAFASAHPPLSLKGATGTDTEAARATDQPLLSLGPGANAEPPADDHGQTVATPASARPSGPAPVSDPHLSSPPSPPPPHPPHSPSVRPTSSSSESRSLPPTPPRLAARDPALIAELAKVRQGLVELMQQLMTDDRAQGVAILVPRADQAPLFPLHTKDRMGATDGTDGAARTGQERVRGRGGARGCDIQLERYETITVASLHPARSSPASAPGDGPGPTPMSIDDVYLIDHLPSVPLAGPSPSFSPSVDGRGVDWLICYAGRSDGGKIKTAAVVPERPGLPQWRDETALAWSRCLRAHWPGSSLGASTVRAAPVTDTVTDTDTAAPATPAIRRLWADDIFCLVEHAIVDSAMSILGSAADILEGMDSDPDSDWGGDGGSE